jgi:hypothetical protein
MLLYCAPALSKTAGICLSSASSAEQAAETNKEATSDRQQCDNFIMVGEALNTSLEPEINHLNAWARGRPAKFSFTHAS